MAGKRKFKRDYIILEAKDTNFRYKERVLPKAFAKVEVNDEKSVVALYLENIKYMKDGYRVVAIQSDYETVDLGKVVVNEQGKGDFVLDLVNDEAEIKGIAILYERTVPLIGFKGAKIDNYEEILFTGDEEEYEYVEVDDNGEYEYEEIEYIEVDDDGEYDYEEIEYIEVDEDDEYDTDYYEENNDNDEQYEYEEIEYIEIDEEDDYKEDGEYENHEEYEEINNYDDYITPRPLTYVEPKKHQPQRPQAPKQQVSKQSIQKPIMQKQQLQRPQPQKQVYTQPQPEQNNKPAGALLMPRQIKKGLKYFREVKPFVCDYVEDTRWWKIEISPTTLCGYTMPYLGYVNTLNFTMYSDAIMNSYKYRHYLFGVQYDEYNKRKNYIYAVPGRQDEQPDRGHTGFSTYQACDTRNDSLGYWLCFIDPRSRRIIK